jgi:CheY-specific phosphatase CheX
MKETDGSTEVLHVLESDLRDATEELFEAYGIPLHYSGPGLASLATRQSPMIASVIGYASEKLRGALAMVATPETILRWMPGLDVTEARVADDTIGEFSNMLLGRLKFKLMQRGVTLLVATPTTASGSNMTLRPPAGLFSRWHSFESPVGGLGIRLDATFNHDFSFEREAPKEAPAAAGDMMLF